MNDANASSEQPDNVVKLPTTFRADAWANPQSGMGMPGIDPRTAWMPYARPRNENALRQLWLGDGLAGRIVEHPAEEMTRERGTVNLGEGYAEAQQQLTADLDELDAWAKFCQVLKYDRAYGGGGLIMAVDDGMDWSMPVDTKRLARVTALHAATPDELYAERYFRDKTHPQYGHPALYRWRPTSLPGLDAYGFTNQLVHASRVIAFTGISVDNQRRVENGGCGDSVLSRCEERIRDTSSSLAGLGVALQNFSQDVITSEKMGEYLADKRGKTELEARIAAMRMAKSMLGVLLLGKGESYTRQAMSMAGVADTVHELAAFLCAVSEMPMAVLMGYAEAGLGDTANSQRRIWHDVVAAKQANRLRPGFNKLIRCMLLAQEGPTRGVEPKKWGLDFHPLERPTPTEEATLRNTYAEIDVKYMEHQARRPEWVARHRFSGPEGFSPNIPPDPYFSEEPPPPASEPSPDDEPLEPAPTPVPGAAAAPPAPSQPEVENVQQLSLNGAQMDAAKGIVQDVAMRKMPRDSGVAMLRAFVNLAPDVAEAVMGDVGRDFFVNPDGTPVTAPGAPLAPPAPRSDSAAVYAALLVHEEKQGTLPAEEVERKVAKLYGVRPRQARSIIRKLTGQRIDAATTNFPRPGENKAVGLKASRFEVFDPAYAQDLRENWPELWALSSHALGDKQFERLLPVARAGGKADTDSEVHAVRLREEWARRNAKKERTAGIVAQVKWLVVGRAGLAGMKAALEKAKDKVRRARAAK